MIDPHHDESVVLSYQKALSGLLRLISGLAAAGAIVYLLGWLRSSGYYMAFKAEWILTNLSFSELASRGIYPICALFVGLMLSFTDIANNYIGRKLTKIILITLVMWLIAIVVISVLSTLGYYRQAVGFANLAVFTSASVAMTQFGEVVLELSKNDFKLRSTQIRTVVWALLSFGAMTFILGSTEGERDKRNATSTLPHVALTDETADIWRLLFIQEEVFYLVKLSEDPPSVKVIKAEKVGTIAPNIKNLSNKIEQQEHPSSKEPHISAPMPEGLGCLPYLSASATLSCCYSGLGDYCSARH